MPRALGSAPNLLRRADAKAAYVEAVATAPDRQNRGHARHVLRVLAEAVSSYEIVALSPSDPAFYAPLGWELWRGLLMARRASVDEVVEGEEAMILRLPGTPLLDLDRPLGINWREGDIW